MGKIVQKGKLTYIFYENKASLLAILEFRIECYFMAHYTLPERAYGLSGQQGKEVWLHRSHESVSVSTGVVQGIPLLLPMSYQFRVL